jgi:uncharacterized protein (DUF4415 family)
MRLEDRGPITEKEKRQLAALRNLRDDQIDTSDMHEWTAEQWKNAVIGKFYRPVKKPVTMRLDADVIAWLKAKGRGYQTKANGMLRALMLDELKQGKASRR